MAPAVQAPTLGDQAFAGIAQAATLAPLMPSAVGKSTVNVAAATYAGQSALGVSFAHRPTAGLVLSGGLSHGTSGQGMVRIGAGFEF